MCVTFFSLSLNWTCKSLSGTWNLSDWSTERRVDYFEQELKKLVWGWEQSTQGYSENQWNFERQHDDEIELQTWID